MFFPILDECLLLSEIHFDRSFHSVLKLIHSMDIVNILDIRQQLRVKKVGELLPMEEKEDLLHLGESFFVFEWYQM